MGKEKRVLEFAVQRETIHGVTRLAAHVVYHNDEGEMLNLLSGYSVWDGDNSLADFVVHAYLNDDGDPYGFGHKFEPHSVDLDQAEKMVKVLRKVARGLDKANADQGYLRDEDFASYLIRVARILGIKTFHVRNNRRHKEMSGQTYRRTDGSGLQSWVRNREQHNA